MHAVKLFFSLELVEILMKQATCRAIRAVDIFSFYLKIKAKNTVIWINYFMQSVSMLFLS